MDASIRHRPQVKSSAWRRIKIGPQVVYRLGLGWVIGGIVLLLTTTGRKTGLRRVTPLQYEKVDGLIAVASARGLLADWVQNIAAHPRVELQIGSRRISGTAEIITDPAKIADFLELRLKRHPIMVGAMLRAEGLKVPVERAALEAHAARLAMVIVCPSKRGLSGISTK